MTETEKQQNAPHVREAVGVFDDADTLQAAIDDLQEHGFDRVQISVLASEDAIEEKLGHVYAKVEDAEDDPDAPRTIFVDKSDLGDAEGAVIGAPLYLAAVTTAAVVAASGGTLLTAIAATAAAGAAGTAVGSVFADLIESHHAEYLQKQLDRGGLLLWVNTATPEQEQKAREILQKHSAHDVHLHDIPL